MDPGTLILYLRLDGPYSTMQAIKKRRKKWHPYWGFLNFCFIHFSPFGYSKYDSDSMVELGDVNVNVTCPAAAGCVYRVGKLVRFPLCVAGRDRSYVLSGELELRKNRAASRARPSVFNRSRRTRALSRNGESSPGAARRVPRSRSSSLRLP